MTAQRSRKPLLAGIAVAIFALVAAYLALPEMFGGEQTTAPVKRDAGPGDDTIVDEEERLAYIAQFVTVTGLEVGPDQKPDDAGPVGGLFSVKGTVKNNGTRGLKTIRLVVHPQDASGNVLGTNIQDVLFNKRLGPGESRDFKFVIPEKKEFAGKFTHELR